MESRGSVIPLFKKLKIKHFSITHPEMTRFNIQLKDSVELINFAINYSCGECLFKILHIEF